MTRSTAELLLATQLTQAGIPYVREFRFAPPRRWRADFALIPKRKWWLLDIGIPIGDVRPSVLVEVEGGSFGGGHRRGINYEKDTERASAAAILGYRVIRCTPRQVEDGRCLSWIQQALGLEASAA